MINSFIFDDNYFRTIPACIIDGRNGNPAVAGQIGDSIKTFCDAEVAKADPLNVLTYKLETVNGNLIGAMSLRVIDGIATQYQLWLRQAFKVYLSEIEAEISIFITGQDWMFDQLL